MKRILLVVMLIFGMTVGIRAEDLPLNWLSSYADALTQAKKEGKAVLMEFSGSDWNLQSQFLDKSLLSSVPFKNYASKNLVLLKVDFPRNQAQSPDQKEINDKLAKDFGVPGFPTIVLVDPQGRKIAEWDSVEIPCDPKAFLEALQKFKLPPVNP